jgi:hypothetical protein
MDHGTAKKVLRLRRLEQRLEGYKARVWERNNLTGIARAARVEMAIDLRHRHLIGANVESYRECD